MANDENDKETPEKSESWEDLPEGIKKENMQIAANSQGDPEEESVEESSSDGDSVDDK